MLSAGLIITKHVEVRVVACPRRLPLCLAVQSRMSQHIVRTRNFSQSSVTRNILGCTCLPPSVGVRAESDSLTQTIHVGKAGCADQRAIVAEDTLFVFSGGVAIGNATNSFKPLDMATCSRVFSILPMELIL